MFRYESIALSKGFKAVAGIDEVGRGSLAGPVVAAAVIIKEKKFKNRIYDSKCLTKLQREKAFFEIIKKAVIGIGMVNEVVIDRINISSATKAAMELAVLDLNKKPDFLLIDGKIELCLDLPSKKIIKGDAKSLSIASASIIAKVYRDRIMDIYHKIFPQYNFLNNKGYGTRGHFMRLRKFGPSPIHRKTFL